MEFTGGWSGGEGLRRRVVGGGWVDVCVVCVCVGAGGTEGPALGIQGAFVQAFKGHSRAFGEKFGHSGFRDSTGLQFCGSVDTVRPT